MGPWDPRGNRGPTDTLEVALSGWQEADSFLLEELFDSNPVSRAMQHTEDTITGLMPTEVSIHTGEPGGDDTVETVPEGQETEEALEGFEEESYEPGGNSTGTVEGETEGSDQ